MSGLSVPPNINGGQSGDDAARFIGNVGLPQFQVDQQQQQQQQFQQGFGMPFTPASAQSMPSEMMGQYGSANAPGMMQAYQQQFQQHQQQSQQQPYSASDVSGLSAIHAPIDFGGSADGMGGGAFSLNQNQPFGMPQNFFNDGNSSAGASSMMQGAPMMLDPSSFSATQTSNTTATGTSAVGNEGTKKAPAKPRAKPKPKPKKDTDGTAAQEAGDDAAAKPPKQTKPRKRKTASGDGTTASTNDAPVGDSGPNGEGTSAQIPSAEAGQSESSRGRGTGRGRGGAGRGGGGGRKPSKKQQLQLQQQTVEGGTPGPQLGSDNASRPGSVAPGTPATVTGESTPTKRGGRASGGGGRGSRGGRGRRGGAAGRAGSRGSRQTSARMTASVAPGADDGGTAAPEDALTGGMTGVGAAANEDADDDEAGGESSDDEHGADEGLEEDELDRQEAIQRQRSINMGPLMKSMNEDQLDRYSAFRRHYLDKRFVRRLVYHLTRQTVTPQVTTLCAGVGKVFVGEIVEGARAVRAERGEGQDDATQPLQPEHLIESLRRYRQEREVPGRFPPGASNATAGIGGNGQRRRMF